MAVIQGCERTDFGSGQGRDPDPPARALRTAAAL